MSWKFCPSCGCQLPPHAGTVNVTVSAAPAYDQELTWRSILGSSPGPIAEQIAAAAVVLGNLVRDAAGAKVTTLVHLLFDKSVTPSGGLLSSMVSSLGKLEAPITPARLALMGYAIGSDGKVVTVDDVPVGPIYNLLQYWGGEKQHKRWHLVEPISISPSPNDKTAFMDGRMVAFGATWKDAEVFTAAMEELYRLLVVGTDKMPGLSAQIQVLRLCSI